MMYTVLVVDDSKLARMAAYKALQSLYPAWSRIEAASAEEALALVAQSHPDIALLDFNMPGQNGLDLAAEIRRANPSMPVAVISANRQREVIERANAVGAFYLPKPLTEVALAEFLKTAVEELKIARS